MRNSTAMLIGVASVLYATGVRPLAVQSARAVMPIFVDYVAPPPAHLDQFASAVDAIVRVRIETISFDRPIDAISRRSQDVTLYEARVLDIAKANPMLPSTQGTFTITRVGGQHLENGHTLMSAQVGFEAFQPLGEYVFFLTWNPRTKAFGIAYGPNGSYQLLPTGIVRPLGQSDVARAQQGKRLDVFLQELKAASAR